MTVKLTRRADGRFRLLVLVTVFSFLGSYVLYKVTDFFIPLRVTPEQEEIGLDISQHGEVMDEAAAKAAFAL